MGFLGIDIKRHDDGSIEFFQTGLIDRFLDAVELTSGTINTRLEPAHKEPERTKMDLQDVRSELSVSDWDASLFIKQLPTRHSLRRKSVCTLQSLPKICS